MIKIGKIHAIKKIIKIHIKNRQILTLKNRNQSHKIVLQGKNLIEDKFIINFRRNMVLKLWSIVNIEKIQKDNALEDHQPFQSILCTGKTLIQIKTSVLKKN
jgi:hypothetical protein